MRKLASLLLLLATLGGGTMTAVALANYRSTGTNAVCATRSSHGRRGPHGGSSQCTTTTYTTPTTTTTVSGSQTQTSTTSTTSTTATTPTTTTSTTSGPPSPPGSFQSVVFWLAWDPYTGNLASQPWKAVTQVDLMSLATCVSAGNPDSDCTGPTSLDTLFNGVTGVSSFVSTVHAGGAKAIITIGGSTNPNWYYPCQNSADAATFARNLVNWAQTNGFDGVDLDIEQDTTTGSPAFSAIMLQECTQDVAQDAAAANLIVTSDVDPTTDYDIGQIENPYIGQFNAMSYGASGSGLASQIEALETQSGIPASKITEGVDIQDDPSTIADCGPNAGWAKQNGLAGAMLWFGQQDETDSPAYGCLNAVAPYVG